MDKNSKAFTEGGYEDMFEAAESAKLAAEDVVTYHNSLAYLHSVQSGLDFRYDQGREEGMKEGIRKGLLKAARNMLTSGMGVDKIAQLLGLPTSEIAALK